MGEERGCFCSSRWSAMVSFMLVLPQVGISAFGGFLDFYRIVFLFLGGWVLVVFFAKRVVLHSRVVFFWLAFLLAIIVPWGGQAFLNEYGAFYAHVSSELGRYDSNLTYGVVSYVSRDFLGGLGFKFVAVFLMGFLLSIYLAQMPVLGRINFLCVVVFSAALFQAFYVAIYFLGGLEFFLKSFMVGATADQFSGGVSTRLGMLRFPGGFSEPSFMAVVLFGAVFSIFLILYKFELSLSFSRRFFLVFSLFFLFFTTASVMVLFVALCCLFFFSFGRVGKTSFLLCGLFFWGLSIFLQVFSFFFTADVVPVGMESISVRQLMVTPWSEMSWGTYLIGYAFSEVYNFPFINNLVLQVGLLGALFMFVAFFSLGVGSWVIFGFFCLVISVSPNLGHSYLYVCLGLLIGSMYPYRLGRVA